MVWRVKPFLFSFVREYRFMAEEARVCHYTPFYSKLEGGIKTSVKQQKKALGIEGVDFVEKTSEEFDILHLNYFDPLSVFRFFQYRYFSDKKVLYHSHVTGEDFKNSMRFSNALSPLVGLFTSFFYRRADKVIAPSDYTKNLLKSKNIADVEVISNGIDTERLVESEKSKSELREKYADNDFVAINLGLVFERKGLSTFIETAEKMPEIDFIWFGPKMNGILRSGKTKKKMRNSPDNVKFPGFIEDINDAFKLADAFFFPTREENQGISLLEASYKGLPVIIRDIPTYEDWLEDRKHCLKGENSEEFAEILKEVKEDKELRSKLSKNAKKMAENHSLDKIGLQLHQVYQNLEEDG